MFHPASRPSDTSGAVPTSPGRNRYANRRMVWVGGTVLAFLLIAIFVPW